MAQRPHSRSKKPKRKLQRVDPKRALQPDEVEKLKAWALGVVNGGTMEYGLVRDAVIALVLLGTGARRFELCAFRCGDFTRGIAPIVQFDEAKGAKTAEIAISEETWNTVVRWVAWKRAHDENVASTAPLFCGRPGEHMSVATLHNIWKNILERAGLPTRYGVHASRHAAGLMLLRATNSLSQTAEFLRHSSERVTERFYKHVLPSDVRAGLTKAGL